MIQRLTAWFRTVFCGYRPDADETVLLLRGYRRAAQASTREARRRATGNPVIDRWTEEP